MSTDPTPPNGCRHCGLVEREHGTRWTLGVGYHVWAAPSDTERKERMLARREGRRG